MSKEILCPHCKISNATRADDGTMKKNEVYRCESCGKMFVRKKKPPREIKKEEKDRPE